MSERDREQAKNKCSKGFEYPKNCNLASCRVTDECAETQAREPLSAEQFYRQWKLAQRLSPMAALNRFDCFDFAEAYAASLRERNAQLERECEGLRGDLAKVRQGFSDSIEARELLGAQKKGVTDGTSKS